MYLGSFLGFSPKVFSKERCSPKLSVHMHLLPGCDVPLSFLATISFGATKLLSE